MNKWKKTAKIQKKWDFPKGQPHFLTLKIVYGKRSRSFPANILTQSYILHLTLRYYRPPYKNHLYYIYYI